MATTRRYDLDWLRILAVLLLFPYHTARIFDSVPHFYIKSEDVNTILDLFARFMEQWHMPLFFTVAGAASWFALSRRPASSYMIERLQRLLIPLLVGVLIILPTMGYVAVRYRGAPLSFWAYYPTFFRVDLAHLDGFTGTFTPAHLWFILFLLGFSLLSLPLFRHLQQESGRNRISRVATPLAARPYLIWLAVIPIYLARLTGLPYPNPLFFWLFFTYGYLLLAIPRLEDAIARNHRVALMIGLVTMSAYLLLKATGFPLDDYTDAHPLYQLFLSVNNVAWLLLILSTGRRYLNRPMPSLRYFNQSAYPLYLLHQTILVGLAFWVLSWPVSTLAHFGLITLLTLGITVFVYEYVVRRFSWLQFALGVKA